MHEALKEVESSSFSNIIFDTTGSVVHTGDDLCAALKAKTVVVYIRASDEQTEALFRQYSIEPKPTVFGHLFRQETGEDKSDAMMRSYVNLLKYRGEKYAFIADVTIDHLDLLSLPDAVSFLNAIRKSL
jgi:hypothetical protein